MFKGIFKKRSEDVAGAKLYALLMAQSRQPAFYGQSRFEDSYEGRIDLLSLHQGVLMHRLRDEEAAGEALTQALYDIMVEDFNIALREEGLADTGISRRIKPMISRFYARLKSLHEAFDSLDGSGDAIEKMLKETVLPDDGQSDFGLQVSAYLKTWRTQLEALDIAQIKQGKIGLQTFICSGLV